MKDTKDAGTTDMFGVKRRRGRPCTGEAKSGAERQAAYRAKQALETITITISRDDSEELLTLLVGLSAGYVVLDTIPGVSGAEQMDRELTKRLARTIAQTLGPESLLRG
jgi:hypothetical protein